MIKKDNDRFFCDYEDLRNFINSVKNFDSLSKGNLYIYNVKLPKRKLKDYFPDCKTVKDINQADFILFEKRKIKNLRYWNLSTKELDLIRIMIVNKDKAFFFQDVALSNITFEQFKNIEFLMESYQKENQILGLQMCTKFAMSYEIKYLIGMSVVNFSECNSDIQLLYKRYKNTYNTYTVLYMGKDRIIEDYIKDPKNELLHYLFNKHFDCKLKLIENG
jgi:hypothetical protein